MRTRDAKLKASYRKELVKNMEGFGIGSLFFSIAWSLIWGFATAGVRERKGYGRRWFWFGFFLGLIPFIIACAIPARPEDSYDEAMRSLADQKALNYLADNASGWQCSCGRTNAVYVSTCSCGLGKRQSSNSGEQAVRTSYQSPDSELKKYAMMLDSQVISQSEYDAKVKELLNNR